MPNCYGRCRAGRQLVIGWRDPELVHVALRMCGTCREAERAMALARRAVDERYERASIRDLAKAMRTLGATHSNDNYCKLGQWNRSWTEAKEVRKRSGSRRTGPRGGRICTDCRRRN